MKLSLFNESKWIPCLLIVDQEQFINILVIGKKYFSNVRKFRRNNVYLKKKIIKKNHVSLFLFYVWYWLNNLLYYIEKRFKDMKVLTCVRFERQCQRSNIKTQKIIVACNRPRQKKTASSNVHFIDPRADKAKFSNDRQQTSTDSTDVHLSESIWIAIRNKIRQFTNHVYLGRV